MSQTIDVDRIELGDGRAAMVRRAQAPLSTGDGTRLAWFLEGAFGVGDKPDVFVSVAAKGLLEDVARNDFAWAEVDGAIVATAWTMSPADEPRLATLGEVFTAPAFRGHGLAPAVCRALLERFDADGGRLIFLATSNLSAARIYRALGFEPYPRGLMRRVRPADASSAFDETWFASSATTIRPIHWGDVPRIVALYAAPNPWLSAAWMEGIYSASAVIHDRCNSLVKNTWQATRAGAWLGLFNAEGALVGSGPMEPRGNKKEVVAAAVDLFVHPAFAAAAADLLAAMVEEQGCAAGTSCTPSSARPTWKSVRSWSEPAFARRASSPASALDRGCPAGRGRPAARPVGLIRRRSPGRSRPGTLASTGSWP